MAIINIHTCSNKLSLNIEKSNFVIFHPPQRKITLNFELTINEENLHQENGIKYLLIDSNLNWKPQIECIAKKLKKIVGILPKKRYIIMLTLQTLPTSIILNYTYPITLIPLYVLQKKVMRIIRVSKFDNHSNPNI